MQNNKVLVTGVAGFIGFHLAEYLLKIGFEVIGLDSFTNYYDINLKKDRVKILKNFKSFKIFKIDISDKDKLFSTLKNYNFEIIFHLAAQAGVRHSITNPESYLTSNIVGSFNILELSKDKKIKHLLIASTSSVYGDCSEVPFTENFSSNKQLSFYAASKKSCEVISHSYSHIHKIPTTVFRFFTVYGPWGRPDMALYKFATSIFNDQPIDIYNFGKMKRDFTYVGDLIKSIIKLSKCIPELNKPISKIDSISPIAAWRVVNIGNSKPVELMKFIETLENKLGAKAKKNFLPMQMGDVKETYADNTLLKDLTNYIPKTDINEGIEEFVIWLKYYLKKN